MTAIGIDLGGTKIKIGILRGSKLLATRQIEAKADQKMAAKLGELSTEVNKLLGTNQIDPKTLRGIGLAFPSIVDNQNKRILSRYVKFTDADEVDFEKWARKCWNIPLVLENDARAALVGEWQFGAGKGHNHIVMVTLGTGVGTAVLDSGRLLRGAHHFGGNLGGHTIINVNGSRCNCGGIGCVETEASGWALHDRYKDHPLFSQSALSREAQLTYESVFSPANQLDPLAQDIRTHSLKVWAANVLNLAHHFDPEMVIIGGGIMNSGNQIIPYVQQYVDKGAWQPAGTIKIVSAQQSDLAGVLGMGYLAVHE